MCYSGKVKDLLEPTSEWKGLCLILPPTAAFVFFFCSAVLVSRKPDFTRSHFTTETLSIRVNG